MRTVLLLAAAAALAGPVAVSAQTYYAQRRYVQPHGAQPHYVQPQAGRSRPNGYVNARTGAWTGGGAVRRPGVIDQRRYGNGYWRNGYWVATGAIGAAYGSDYGYGQDYDSGYGYDLGAAPYAAQGQGYASDGYASDSYAALPQGYDSGVPVDTGAYDTGAYQGAPPAAYGVQGYGDPGYSRGGQVCGQWTWDPAVGRYVWSC